MTNRFLDFLFTPAAVLTFVVILVVSVYSLWVRRKNWAVGPKAAVGAVAVVCLLYLALVVVMAVGFGQTPPEPVPVMPG